MTQEELNGFAETVRIVVREELKPIGKRLGDLENRMDCLETKVGNFEGSIPERVAEVLEDRLPGQVAEVIAQRFPNLFPHS